MTDLDKLIEAVEAGDKWDEAQYRVLGEGTDNVTLYQKAFDGSLDAALRLHEALLPGWNVQRLFGPYRNDPRWRITIKNMEHLGDEESAIAATPARAWLLAILRAVKAKTPDIP